MPSSMSILEAKYPDPPKRGKCVQCVHFECCPGDECGWGLCRLGLAETPPDIWWVFGEDFDVCEDGFEAVRHVAA